MVRKSTSTTATLRALGNFMYRVGEGEVGGSRRHSISVYNKGMIGFAVIILGTITRFSLFHYSPRL